MKENNTIQYIPPVSEVVEVKSEGVICMSGIFDGFGEEEIW